MSKRYLIALGSNVRHARHGRPRAVLMAAVERLAIEGVAMVAMSKIITSDPLGPSRRRYANAAAVVASDLAPLALLATLKRIERSFGRRRGRRWGARALDLDIILWDGGEVRAAGLLVPHPAFRHRSFVLAPAAAIAPTWRDPVGGLTIRQLHARLTRRRPLPYRADSKGP